MEMTMNHLIAILSLCFLLTCSSAAEKKPFCNIMDDIGNETWREMAVNSILHGDFENLKCTAGCLIYTINENYGDFLKQTLSIGYVMFDNCIKTGVRNHDTCMITDCVLNAAENAFQMMRDMGIKLPFMEFIEKLPIFSNKDAYEVANEQHETKKNPALPQSIPNTTTTTTTTVAPETTTPSGSYSQTPAFSLLNIFGIVIAYKLFL